MSHSHSCSPLAQSPAKDGEGNLSQTKRKRPSAVKVDERKKVSRACDACKEKKVRCAGTQPCPRCINQSLSCLYNKAHRRGKPSPPAPGIPIGVSEQGGVPAQYPSGRRINIANSNDLLGSLDQPNDQHKSSRSSQEADNSRFEGEYIGPTSGIAFLHRAQKRFHQDYVAIKSKAAVHQGSQKVSVFSFGDGWVPDCSGLEFSLPIGADACSLLDRYFDFAMPTYRFVHRPTIESWLDIMREEANMGGKSISNAKKAIVVLVLATAKLYNENAADLLPDGQTRQSEESGLFFIEAERLLNGETGPVRVESVQARLAQCIHLLASSRINHAWYVFGTATQMISALGLHRKRHTGSAAISHEDGGSDCRKQVFWSAYTLDRYLSVILGRPRIFRDEDVDQILPDKSNESGWNSSPMESRASMSVSDGPVYHARLAKILGSISSDLYTSRSTDTGWMESAERWTSELKQWKESLPAFLEPLKVDPSMLVPIFQRQSTVLTLAYAHALILANRPALLNSFAELSRSQGLPVGEPTGSLKECIDAALVVVVTVNGLIEARQMRKAFWFTHYISFCAISALYVYTIQQCLPSQIMNFNVPYHLARPTSTRVFEAAVKCQKRIEDTTTMTSPFRRYNIILDELKKEVIHRLEQGRTRTSQEPATLMNEHRVMDSSGGTPSTTPNNPIISVPSNLDMDQSIQQYQNARFPPHLELNNLVDMRQTFGSSSTALDDSMMMDLGIFGMQGELMGWSEFDSCVGKPMTSEYLDLQR